MHMPVWYLRLFVHLVELSHPDTMKGSTSYAQLGQLLTPPQPLGGRGHDVPTTKAIRTALDRFADCGLIERSKEANAASQSLGYVLAIRV